MGKTLELDVNRLLSSPSAPAVTPQGPAGATTHGYAITKLSVSREARRTAASPAGVINNGAAVLGATQFNRVTWASDPLAGGYEVWRTAGPSGLALGLIATLPAGATQFDDVGIQGNGETPPTVNQTGLGQEAAVLHLQEKLVRVEGVFTATVQMEARVGVEWFDVEAPFTAKGHVRLPYTVELVRTKLTAYESGTPRVFLAGQYTERP